MYEAPDILMMAYKQPIMQDQLIILQEKERQIPGSVQYTIKRYRKNSQWNMDDMGMLVYHYGADKKGEDTTRNYLELRFCIAGNAYCQHKENARNGGSAPAASPVECDACKLNATPGCTERVETVDVISFRFLAVHLSQFIRPRKTDSSVSEDLLDFRHTTSFSKTLSLCGRTRIVLETLLNHSYTDSLENIFINAQSQMLLDRKSVV